MPSYIPAAPVNFRTINIDQKPTPKVELGWDEVTNALLRSDWIYSNDSSKISNSSSWLSVHFRFTEGYRIYRGATDDFTPSGEAAGQGNCIVDENTLSASTVSWTDLDVSQGNNYYYKICAIINKGNW